MNQFTPDRRSLMKGGATLLAAAATMTSEQLLGYAKAWAQTAQWKPEPGAKINLLRWKRFVEAEDVAFMKIVDAFQKATGTTISVSNESYDDLQPKASVAANTGNSMAYNAYVDKTKAALMALGQGADQAKQAAIGHAYQQMLRQASMLSYMNAFWVLSVIIACLIPLPFIMRKPPARVKAALEAAH